MAARRWRPRGARSRCWPSSSRPPIRRPLRNAVLAKTAEYLGIGIGNLINLFNPGRVILGGWAGLLLGGRLLPAIRESAGRNSLRHLFAGVSIELGQVGPEAVTYGAATLPMEDFLNGASRPPLRNRCASIDLQP